MELVLLVGTVKDAGPMAVVLQRSDVSIHEMF